MAIIDERVGGKIIWLTRCNRCDGDAILVLGVTDGRTVLCTFCTRKEMREQRATTTQSLEVL